MAYILGAPGLYVQGKGEITNIGKYASILGRKFLVVINEHRLSEMKLLLEENVHKYDCSIDYGVFSGECTYGEMERLAELFAENGDEVVVGIGGGKALDTAKGVANKCNAPVVIVPTSAAQDAPALRLSVVYNEAGEFESYMDHPRNPDMVIVDSQVIANAPVRLLAAGMGDGLATVFEAHASGLANLDNALGGKATHTGVAFAELCYDIIINNGLIAYKSVQNNVVTRELDAVIEANIYLSGLGAEATGDSVAHALYNSFTAIEECRKYLHGELVAFGILVQLVLENKQKELEEVLSFIAQVGLPITLSEIGIDVNDKVLVKSVAKRAIDDTAANEPFDVDEEDLYAAIMVADSIGREYRLK